MRIDLRIKLFLYAILIIILFSYIVFKEKGVIEYFKLEKKYQELVQENNNLKKDRKKLLEIIHKLKTDKEYIEKIAREKYNMIKEGEILIKVKRTNNKGGKK